MSFTRNDLRRWVEEQVRALIDAGVDPEEAEETMREVLAEIPEGMDPKEYWPPAAQASPEISDVDVESARRSWRHSDAVPDWAKNLLDAVELPEED